MARPSLRVVPTAMDLTVLVKVVAERATLQPEPAGGLAQRTEATSFVNPFDQRALRAAVDLRRPGEKITIVSMGPSYAERFLAPYLDAGVDRVLLLSDDRLRGSDVVATARTLAHVLRPLGPQIVLAGERAIDSEVGVLAAAVSPHLWFPAVAGARSISRDPSGTELTVTVDTDNGWARYAVRAPCIISVGEKIARPLKPGAPEVARSSAVERIDLQRLSTQDGAPLPLAARTRILRWRELGRSRATHRYDSTRTGEGLTALRAATLPHPQEIPRPPLAPLVPARAGALDREILVLATGPDGRIGPRVLPVLRDLAVHAPGFWRSVVWAGPRPSLEVTGQLAAAGAARGYVLHCPVGEVLPVVATLALERVFDRRPSAAAVVLPDDRFARQVAGRLASRLDRGLVTAVEQISTEPDETLAWTKPSFGSRAWVTVSAARPPTIVLLRSTTTSPPFSPIPLPLDWIDVAFEIPLFALRPLDQGVEVGPEFGVLDLAEIVVGIGMGVGGPESVRALLPMLGGLGAALAASRRVVDAGWAPPQLQVGLTGRSVAPRIGILVGVSGSSHQMIGWRRAETLIAINSDPEAPVFSQVDFGFVGRWEELLPRVIDAVASRS